MESCSDGSCRILDQGTLAQLLSRGRDLSKFVEAKEKLKDEVLGNDVRSKQVEPSNDGESPIISSNGSIQQSTVEVASTSEESTDQSPVLENIKAINDLIECSEYGCAIEELDHSGDSSSLSTEPMVSTLFNSSKLENEHLESTQNDEKLNSIKLNKNIHTSLINKEERGEGSVGWDIYESYFKASNKPFLLVLVLLSFLLANASQVLQQWVVAVWTSDTGYAKRPLPMYLGSVGAMAFCVAFFNWSRTFFGVLLGAESSQTLHSQMARAVLNAPLSYFGMIITII
jgi:hypothetical protein